MNTFVIANPKKCIGCKACEIACAVAHIDKSVVTANKDEIPFSPRVNLIRADIVTTPIQCRQCEDAPCANVCPVSGIIHQDDKIIIKTEQCIGCKTCILACPIGAMNMVHDEATLKKESKLSDTTNLEPMVAIICDLCVGREGGPACVEICPAEAFILVEQKDINEISKNKRKASTLRTV